LPTSPISRNVLLDDRLVVARLVGEPLRLPKGRSLHTTPLWYYRAVHAAIEGGAGKLSGPFARLDAEQQGIAIQALLDLPDDLGLPESRALARQMADVVRRHPKLNALNVEAVAAARLLEADVLLSPPAAQGVLPPALDAEGIGWRVVTPPGR
jgi:hypothetical protein